MRIAPKLLALQLGLALALVPFASASAAPPITFEGVIPTDPISPCFGTVAGCTPPLVVDGFRFTALAIIGSADHFHLVSAPWAAPGTAPALQRYPSNGTQYIGLDTPGISMELVSGGVFSLLGFDAAEGYLIDSDGSGPSPFLPTSFAEKIRVTGYLVGGGTVSTVFDFDGINDGPGGVTDFQTFALSGFLGLTKVDFVGLDGGGSISGAGSGQFFSIDNINATPAAVPLLGPIGISALVAVLMLAGWAALRHLHRTENATAG
jgi:hypothetical protein